MEKHYFNCSCHSPEHTLEFMYDNEDDLFYVVTFLNNTHFLCRIWNATKYIFGYKCKYGHFNEFILKNEDVNKLIKLLEISKNNG